MARYFLRFRHTDTGLSPVFTFFKKASDLSNVSPPSISEVGSGTYYFDYTPTFDIVFEVDGGGSIPTEEVRYVSDTITPKDGYVDEPISQVKDDVWNDATDRGAGTKGQYVESIGLPADNSVQATVFGKMLAHKESVRGDSAGGSDGNSVKQVYDRVGAPAGATVSADIAAVKAQTQALDTRLPSDPADASDVQTQINAARDQIRGSLNLSITDIAGTDFVASDDTLHDIKQQSVAGASNPAAIADAVWDEALSGHQTAGSAGEALETASNIVVDNAAIATSVWNKDISAYAAGQPTAGSKVNDLSTADENIAAIKAKTDNLPANTASELSTMKDQLTRTLGLLHENSVMDSTSFDGDNNLLSARLRIYDTKANAEAAASSAPLGGTTGLLGTYTITAEYTGGNLTKYTVVKA
jgi:hypothetical protein